MKPKLLLRMAMIGAWEAEQLGLVDDDNWTPLLVYIHTSRLIAGLVLGFLCGVCAGWGSLCLYVMLAL